MHRKRRLIQVALELKACVLNEALIIRIVNYGWQVIDRVHPAHPLKVHVDKGVPAGKEPCGFGRGLFPQLPDQGQGCRYQENDQGDRESSLYAHR